jgi:hypothetical protein
VRHSELVFHRQVAAYLRVALREPMFWVTFPSGGGGKKRGAILKSMGLVAGVPDILIFGPGPTVNNGATFSRVIGLELKTQKGRQSDSQKEVARKFQEFGGLYLLARNLDDVEIMLRAAGVPLHARARGGI